MNEEIIAEIVRDITSHFKTFGGGKYIPGNPISVALQGEPPQFARGVNVEEVVQFIVSKMEE